ncbi:MAG: glutathione-disulfide reductase [Alphaproteobacteria bacterium]|nr:glutathione-disulfide reductase [Alphaproteobacteria bacterium]
MKQYDLIVIGGGSGGIAGARRAASYGAKVAVCEKSNIGGTCVNLGCVPKKLFYYAAEFSEYFEDSKNYGWDVDVKKFNWDRLLQNKNAEISRLNAIYEKLLSDSKVDFIRGAAKFVSKTEVSVGGNIISAKKILIATGGYPFVPNFPGKEHVLTSDDMFFLKELPKKIIIVGGGFIALEFASIMNGLGCETTLLVRGNSILRNFDRDMIDFLTEEILKKGINIRLDTEIKEVKKKGNKLLALSNKGEFEGDVILYATGRKPNTENLGLKNAGVEINNNGTIKVDSYSKTSSKNIFAVGDITCSIALTPVAINEARAFADSEFGKNKRKINHENIPVAVFSQPSIGTVGLSEENAKKKYGELEIYQTSFRALKHGMSGNNVREFMKILVSKKTNKVVGVHIIGKDAAEIIQLAAVAINCGATKKQFDETIGVHPTSAEELVTMR